ncbi:glycosyltransferase [Amycolatopsis sp. H20-H5]|uniref:glycosyltransferase n=1 Tax=Amycolatopsis sp. H20-H5 TaxID=3046309 RepID=UPI002DBD207C|nr:glycosyltransferase [Amycolatopsis sp. H20-H5]MEC3978254.1 glycosyltransferase [Amycolatopsis sp. H20-H5]
MRVVLSTYGSRGDVEPVVGLAVRLRELGAEARVCAPPDFAERLAGAGVPMVPVGRSARALTAAPPRPSSLPERAAEVIADQFAAVTAAARGCDVLVATGMLPAAAGALSVAEKLGIRSVSVTFQQLTLPSPGHSPLAYPGRPLPPGVTDNRLRWELDAENVNALFGEALNTNRVANGLPPVDDVRGYVVGDRPWLASDPILDPWHRTPDLDVVQTGAWILPHEQPLPDELEAFLDAGPPPVYVGFGSMAMHAQKETAQPDVAKVAIEAIRAQGRRAVVLRGWAGLALIDERDDCFAVGEVNQQALFARVAAVVHHGGAGTTTTAARAGAPQLVVPQLADQPYWAGRVAALGIGAAHDGPAPTFESLSAALSAALSPETRARATAVAGTIRTDGATVAAQLLLDAVSREKPPVSGCSSNSQSSTGKGESPWLT